MSILEKFSLNYIASLFEKNQAAKTDPNAPMRTNHVGAFYPAKAIDVVEASEDDLVNDLVEAYKEQQGHLREFKEVTLKKVEEFLDFAFSHYEVKREGKNGDVLLMSFNQLRKVTITYSGYFTKSVEFNIAKQIIDEIKREEDGKLTPVAKGLLEAFYTKKGDISITGMIRLSRADIPHPRWPEVKNLLSKALRPTDKKAYFRIYERNSTEAKDGWQQISLDFSTL
jgi:hypothetical protein